MKRKSIYLILLPLFVICLSLFFGCNKNSKLSQYLSEYRSDIFMATEGKYSIFANFYEREVPYKADGYVGNRQKALEVTLATEDNTKSYFVRFEYNGSKYQNLLYYDSLQMVHTFVFGVDAPKNSTIEFSIFEGQITDTPLLTLQAKSVRNNNLLSLNAVLSIVEKNEKTVIENLTQNKQFLGEIFIRLLYEDNYCYYYAGIVDRKGKTIALLIDGELGEVLARRES